MGALLWFGLSAVAGTSLLLASGVIWSNRLLRVKYKAIGRDAAVFITGCSSGLGFAFAELLGSRGNLVFATVRKESDAAALKKLKNVVPIICDISNRDDVQKAKDYIERKLRERDIDLGAVINNAGVSLVEDSSSTSDTHLLEMQLSVNVIGPSRVVEIFHPLLKESQGRIVNIGSYFGSFALPTRVGYGASKHALEGLTDGMRRRYLTKGIAVILIKPGNIKTPMNPTYGEDDVNVVVTELVDALESEYPQPRYWAGRVRGIPCKWICRLMSFIPERLADKLLKID